MTADARVPSRQAEEEAEMRPSGLVCGHRNFLDTVDDSTGCGEPIETVVEVYRCTECRIPFHHSCAIRHFETSK